MANVQLKTVVDQINALLNKNYNVISFDSLTEEKLLQVNKILQKNLCGIFFIL